jgi:hypothetical protein
VETLTLTKKPQPNKKNQMRRKAFSKGHRTLKEKSKKSIRKKHKRNILTGNKTLKSLKY